MCSLTRSCTSISSYTTREPQTVMLLPQRSGDWMAKSTNSLHGLDKGSQGLCDYKKPLKWLSVYTEYWVSTKSSIPSITMK